MLYRLKYFILIFLVSSILFFFLTSFLLNIFIKDRENYNINIDYSLSHDLIKYLQIEETKMRDVLKKIGSLGYELKEEDWLFANDGLYYTLFKLYEKISLDDLFTTVIENNYDVRELKNEDIQKSRLGRKNIIRLSNKLNLSYSFYNSDIAQILIDNQELVKDYINLKLFIEIESIYNENYKFISDISENLNYLENFCSEFKSDKIYDIEKNNLNHTINNFKSFPDLWLNENFKVDYYCHFVKAYYQKINLTENNNIKLTNLNEIISLNSLLLKYDIVKKSSNISILILGFFTSITFGLFMSMLFFRIQENKKNE